MSNDLILSQGVKVGNVSYDVRVDKSSGKLTLTAQNSAGASRTISIFANGNSNGRKDVYDNEDRVTIKGDSSVEFDIGFLNHVLDFVHNQNYKSLDAEQFGDAQILNKTFNPTQGNRQLATFGQLGKNAEIAYNQATGNIQHGYRQPSYSQHPYLQPNGVPYDGGPWWKNGYSLTNTKPLSPRAQEYQNKLSQLTSELNSMRSWYQRLVNYYPTVLRDCRRVMNQLSYCGDFSMFGGYVSAGNGTPEQMVYKYQAKMNELSQALMSYSDALAKLDREYADVANEVRTETTYIPGGWQTPPQPFQRPAYQVPEDRGNDNNGGYTINDADDSDNTKETKKRPKNTDESDETNNDNENDGPDKIKIEETDEEI